MTTARLTTARLTTDRSADERAADVRAEDVIGGGLPEADASASMSSAGLVGTPEYIAPEMLAGAAANPRIDIYALGVVMYQLLTGATPFSGTTLMEILSHSALDDAVPPRQRAPEADIPEAVEAVVMRAIAREPEDRFQTAEALHEAIDAALNEHGAAAVGWWSALTASPARLGAALISAALAVALLVFVLLPADATPEPAPEGAGARLQEHDQKNILKDAAPAVRPADEAVDRPQVEEERATSVAAAAPDEREGASSTGSDVSAEADEDDALDDDGDTSEPGRSRAGKRRKPATLSASSFRRTVSRAKKRLRQRCGELGISGMKVTLEVHVAANGRVTRAIPQGTMAGSSLADCVSRVVKGTRFKAAKRSSVHTTILRI